MQLSSDSEAEETLRPPTSASPSMSDVAADGSDIYYVVHGVAESAESCDASPNTISVIVASNADGGLLIADPETGVRLGAYPKIGAACLRGSVGLLPVPSLIWVGLTRKMGIACYRLVVHNRGRQTPRVRLQLMLTVPSAAESVVLLSVAAITGHSLKGVLFVLAAYDSSQNVSVWKIRQQGEGREPSTMEAVLSAEQHETSAVCSMVSSRNRDLWCGFEDGSVAAFRFSDGSLMTRAKHSKMCSGALLSLAFASSAQSSLSTTPKESFRSSVVVGGTELGDIMVWSAVGYNLLRKFPRVHDTAVTALCTIPECAALWSLSTDRVLTIWSLEKKTFQRIDEMGGDSGVDRNSPILNPNDDEKLCPLVENSRLSLQTDPEAPIHCLCYVPSLDVVVGGSCGCELLCWYPSQIVILADGRERRNALPPLVSLSGGDCNSATLELSTSPVALGASVVSDGEPRPEAPIPTTFLSPGAALAADASNLKSPSIGEVQRPLFSAPPPFPQPSAEERQHHNEDSTRMSQEAHSTSVIETLQRQVTALQNSLDQKTTIISSLSKENATMREEFTRELAKELEAMRSEHSNETAKIADDVAKQYEVAFQAERTRLTTALREASKEMAALQRERDDIVANSRQREAASFDAGREHESGQWKSLVALLETERDAAKRATEEALQCLDELHQKSLQPQPSNSHPASDSLPAAVEAPLTIATTTTAVLPPKADDMNSVYSLIDALTSEVRHLKMAQKSQRSKPRTQREIAIQTDDPLSVAQGFTQQCAELQWLVESLESQLHLMEVLLQRHRLAMKALPPQQPSSSTNILTASYLTIRQVLGAQVASALIGKAIENPSDECETTETMVRLLCEELAQRDHGRGATERARLPTPSFPQAEGDAHRHSASPTAGSAIMSSIVKATVSKMDRVTELTRLGAELKQQRLRLQTERTGSPRGNVGLGSLATGLEGSQQKASGGTVKAHHPLLALYGDRM